MNVINIAASSDWRYVQHLEVMMISILENVTSDCFIQFYIIDGGIREKDKNNLIHSLKKGYRNVDVNFLQIDESIYRNFPISRHIKHASYYRISLPDLLPLNINKIIYLDCDMIVKDNIKNLWNVELKDNYIAAVSNTETIAGKYNYLGIQDTSKYFNAGMLIINLDKWRKDHLSAKILNFISKNPEKIVYEDQDALNLFLYDKCLFLHPKWNQTHFFHVKEFQETCFNEEVFNEAKYNPSIIHFTAESKPWRYLDTHPFKSEYYKYLRMSSWAEYIPPEQEIIHSKKIIIFGASGNGKLLLNELKNVNIEPYCFIDNDPKKWDTLFLGKKVVSPNHLKSIDLEKFLIIIASDYYKEISKQLEDMNLIANKHFVIKNFEHLYQYE